MTGQPFRLASGGAIDRARALKFTFDGSQFEGFAGDTLASALLANGVRLVARSFKYHRPRGIYGIGVEEPNALVGISRNGVNEPNSRATMVELIDGLAAQSQNRWPTLRFDVMAINDLLSPLIPAGFYYKTFMWPGSWWMFYEHFIRRAAGMGQASRNTSSARYEKINDFADLLVIGGGPAGLAAALAAGRRGQRVILADENPDFGGWLRRESCAIDGRPAMEWVRDVHAELDMLPNVEQLPRTTVFGWFDSMVFGAVERLDDLPAAVRGNRPDQRLHLIHAKSAILATGAIERPLVFSGNDLPGVMSASAARGYVSQFAVLPGRNAVVYAGHDDAYRTALTLKRAGCAVTVVDPRADSNGALPSLARREGIEAIAGHRIRDVEGRMAVRAVEIEAVDGKARRRIACDVVASGGGWTPTIHLASQRNIRAVFSPERRMFLAGKLPDSVHVVGAAAGEFGLAGCLSLGFLAGGGRLADAPSAVDEAEGAACDLWIPQAGARRKAFIDIQDDVTVGDISLAHRESYVSVEHLKRYTTLGMGTDQGKTSNINGLACMAMLAGKSISATGTTTFRPPFTPVSLGVFAGPERALHYEPIRRTAMHDWHEGRKAVMTEAGLWKRPRAYPLAGESVADAYKREALQVRAKVGLMDASTLGKISVQGPDSAEFLDRIYVNNWKSLKVGRAKYGLMLREDGIAFDDGTTARLGDCEYFMTTTTANAAKVLAHLEFLLQTAWPDLKVHVSSVTEQWSIAVLSGPSSRLTLKRVIEDADLSNAACPAGAVVKCRVAGVPARISRISYSGELAYEIAAPADRGLHVWEALMEVGKPYEITPYGTEAMGALRIEKGHIAGAELDGRTTVADLGLTKLVNRNKRDFVGAKLMARPGLTDPRRPSLVGLRVKDRTSPILAGALLVDEPNARTPVVKGHVSSATWSPALDCNIALGFVQGGIARKGDTIFAADPLRGHVVEAIVCDSVFYDRAGERLHA